VKVQVTGALPFEAVKKGRKAGAVESDRQTPNRSAPGVVALTPRSSKNVVGSAHVPGAGENESKLMVVLPLIGQVWALTSELAPSTSAAERIQRLRIAFTKKDVSTLPCISGQLTPGSPVSSAQVEGL
jgi:hypothetical protein